MSLALPLDFQAISSILVCVCLRGREGEREAHTRAARRPNSGAGRGEAALKDTGGRKGKREKGAEERREGGTEAERERQNEKRETGRGESKSTKRQRTAGAAERGTANHVVRTKRSAGTGKHRAIQGVCRAVFYFTDITQPFILIHPDSQHRIRQA